MNNECLLDLSPIKISKALTTAKVTSDPRVTKQKAGTLLIEVRTESDSKHLMCCERFDELPVTITQHRTLNFSKGVVKNYQLRGMTEEEFTEVDGVNSAYRVIVRRDGKTITTNTWILTFNSVTPPPYVKVGYLHLKVEPYIPNPMRCFGCQQYGHTKTRCSREPKCNNCGKEGHQSENCKASPWCPNCKQADHTASAKECPRWMQEKAILTYRATHGGTYAQARAEVLPPNSGMNYAKKLKGTEEKTPKQSDLKTSNTEKPDKLKAKRKLEAFAESSAKLSKPITLKNRFETLAVSESFPETNSLDLSQFPSGTDSLGLSQPTSELYSQSTSHPLPTPSDDLTSVKSSVPQSTSELTSVWNEDLATELSNMEEGSTPIPRPRQKKIDKKHGAKPGSTKKPN